MYNWYSFEPCDTVFFRGSEPMNIGEHHDATLNFPPPIYTIAGAVRTYLFKKDKEKYKDLIKLGSEQPGFKIVGPFFKLKKETYVPTPYCWFREKKKDKKEKKIKIIKASELKTNLIKSSSQGLLWAKGETELESVGGRWIRWEDLFNKETDKQKVEILNTEDFYEIETRVGIALDKNRRAREHHIYSFSHCRLKKDVSIIFALDIDELGEEGILTLGAEQRFGWFKKEKVHLDFKLDGNFFMSLSLIEGTTKANEAVVATGKIVYLGGWDLHKKFHKPMRGYFPPGTVFNKRLENCIAIG